MPNGNRYAPGLVNAALSVRFAVFARRHCEIATHLGARDFRVILCEAERRQYGVLSSEDRAKAPKRPVPRRCLSVFVRHRLTTVAATPTFNESRNGTAESALPSLNLSAYQPLVLQARLVAYNGRSYAYIQRIAELNSGKRFAFVEFIGVSAPCSSSSPRSLQWSLLRLHSTNRTFRTWVSTRV